MSPIQLWEQIRGSDLSACAQAVLLAMLQFDPSGADLWPSKFRIGIEANVSRSAVTRNIRKLVEGGILVRVSPANARTPQGRFRKTATYRFDPSALAAFQKRKPKCGPQPIDPSPELVEDTLRKLEAL